MKNALIFFLVGVLTVIVVSHSTRQRSTSEAPQNNTSTTSKGRGPLEDVTAQTREAASRVKDAVTGKLEDWHLTPEEIKADLTRTGEVVRTKAHAAGETIADARIVAVIKAKYVLDRDLSALDLSVSVNAGEVTLTGGVATPELIGRAIQLALDTAGVNRVTSKLTVPPAS